MKIFGLASLSIFALILSNCSDDSIENSNVIETYCKNYRYGPDSIFIRENNSFSRKTYKLGFHKSYYGTFHNIHDTLHFEYRSLRSPKNELPFVIKRQDSLIICLLYKAINNKFSNLSNEEIRKINKKILYEQDTAYIEYVLVKLKK